MADDCMTPIHACCKLLANHDKARSHASYNFITKRTRNTREMRQVCRGFLAALRMFHETSFLRYVFCDVSRRRVVFA